MLIDTHAHIIPAFYENPDETIKGIIDAGIAKIINIGTSIKECEQVIAIQEKYPSLLFPAIGLHPEIAFTKKRDNLDDDIQKLRKLLEQHKDTIIAVGECGLEYKDLPEGKEDEIKHNQEYLFRKQVDMALEYDLPLIIHCRYAMNALLPVLKEYNRSFRGVLHSVDGDLAIINELMDMGFFVSFNGIMTFKNALHINELVDAFSLDHIILETDSPFLSPVPVRGTQNTPANMKYIYQYLADKKEVPITEVEDRIEQNVNALFTI